MCLAGVRSLPRSVPQGHRWHLLKLHLNGHYSSSRVHIAGVTQDAGQCCFCKQGPDSVSHIMACPCAGRALEGLAANLPVVPTIALQDLFFQHTANGTVRSYIVAAFAAIWAIRLNTCDQMSQYPQTCWSHLSKKPCSAPG